jgi:DNA-binding response OmpR family regulator
MEPPAPARRRPARPALYWMESSEGIRVPEEIAILLIDSDPRTQAAVEHILLGEGWRVHAVGDVRRGLAALATGRWHLVVASTALAPPQSDAFATLAELARAPAGPGRRGIRVLFLVADRTPATQAALEARRAPYVLKPLHLHDFLDRVGDLLIETGALAEPIRRVRTQPAPLTPKKAKPTGLLSGRGQMFASRADYYMTEEEIAEYERQEAEERKKKKKR